MTAQRTVWILGTLLLLSLLFNFRSLLPGAPGTPAGEPIDAPRIEEPAPTAPEPDTDPAPATGVSQVVQVGEIDAADTDENDERLQRLHALFEAGQFNAAVADLASLRALAPATFDAVKLEWLEQLWQELQEGSTQPALDYSDAHLHRFPHDRDVRLLHAESLAVGGDALEAIRRYYDMLETMQHDAAGEDRDRARDLALEQTLTLVENGAWQPLQSLMAELLLSDRFFVPYQLAFARAEIGLEQYSSARQRLQSISKNDYYAAQAEAMLEEVRTAELAATAIPLQARGRHYVVTGRLDRRATVSLMIDTGASLSALSEERFNEIRRNVDAEFIRRARVNTAGGLIEASVYRLAEFAIGEYRVENIEFLVLELANQDGNDGLLGMNFLSSFKFNIDQQNQLLVLEHQR